MRNACRESSCAAACTMSASTLTTCSSALLRRVPPAEASRARRRNDSVLASATTRVPPPASGPRSLEPTIDAVGRERARRRHRGERARQPSVLQIFVARRRGVPDLDRAEMREIGFGIAHALQHGEPAVLPQRQERRERRMQTGAIGEREDRIARDRDLRPQCVVVEIGVRDDGIEPVVAALELDQHEQVAVVRAGRRRARTQCPRRPPNAPSTRGRRPRRGGKLRRLMASLVT